MTVSHPVGPCHGDPVSSPVSALCGYPGIHSPTLWRTLIDYCGHTVGSTVNRL